MVIDPKECEKRHIEQAYIDSIQWLNELNSPNSKRMKEEIGILYLIDDC